MNEYTENTEMLIMTKRGILRTGYLGYFSLAFRLNDCTHPMQNCHMGMSEVKCWWIKEKK